MTTSSKHKGWRPWVMPSMPASDKPTSHSTTQTKPKSKAPYAETLRNALEEIQLARDRATAEGHAQGLALGQQEGLQQGIQEGHKQGYEEGYQAGYQEGLKKAKEELKEQQTLRIAQLQQLFEQANNQLAHFDENLGETLVSLCCRLAEHILQQEIQAKNYDLLPIINRAIGHLTDDQPVTIRVHPDDYALLTEHAEWKAHWQLQSDPELSPCSVKILAPWGSVDAKLQTRWQEILRTLFPEYTPIKTNFVLAEAPLNDPLSKS